MPTGSQQDNRSHSLLLLEVVEKRATETNPSRKDDQLMQHEKTKKNAPSDVSPLSRRPFSPVSGQSPIDALACLCLPNRERFIRWEMDVEGVPVNQAATEAFEAGLAEALSLETGDYTDETSTVLVRR